MVTNVHCVLHQNSRLPISFRRSSLQVAVELKTRSLLKSFYTLKRMLAGTSTISLCLWVISPTDLQAKVALILYFVIYTHYFDRFFGSNSYGKYIELKRSFFVSENPSFFSGSDDSHIEDVLHVAISFALSCAYDIFSHIVLRKSL